MITLTTWRTAEMQMNDTSILKGIVLNTAEEPLTHPEFQVDIKDVKAIVIDPDGMDHIPSFWLQWAPTNNINCAYNPKTSTAYIIGTDEIEIQADIFTACNNVHSILGLERCEEIAADVITLADCNNLKEINIAAQPNLKNTVFQKTTLQRVCAENPPEVEGLLAYPNSSGTYTVLAEQNATKDIYITRKQAVKLTDIIRNKTNTTQWYTISELITLIRNTEI